MNTVYFSNNTVSPPAHHTFGPFEKCAHLEFSIYPCTNPSCFKMLYVPYPIVCNVKPEEPSTADEEVQKTNEDLEVLPSPFTKAGVLIKSPYPRTEIEIYNSQGYKLYQTTFEGDTYSLPIMLPQGIYLLQYKTPRGHRKAIQFIRL